MVGINFNGANVALRTPSEPTHDELVEAGRKNITNSAKVLCDGARSLKASHEEKTPEEKQTKAKKIAIGVGAAAAGAAAVAGLLIAAKKGKLGTEAQDAVKKAGETVKNILSKNGKVADAAGEEKAASQIKDKLTMKEFKELKKSGKIDVKNWIWGANPDAFTGEVEGIAKNGNKTILNYKNGKLTDSITTNKAGELVQKTKFSATYTCGHENELKFMNKITEKANGETVVNTIGNLEGRGPASYTYVTAKDGKVAENFYWYNEYGGKQAGATKDAKLREYVQNIFDRHNVAKCHK